MIIKVKFILIVLFLTLFVPFLGYTQAFEEFEVDKEGTSEEKAKAVDIKPHLGSWRIYEFGAFQDSMKLDTMLDNYQVYHPVFKNSITSSYLGNYGTPALNNDFFNRNSNVDF